MRGPAIAVTLVLTVLLRVAAPVAAGGSESCDSSLDGTCGVKTSAVVFQEPCTDLVVTYEQLKSMLFSHTVQLFDVRNPDEFQEGRIPDSTNIPLGILEEALKMTPENFKKQFKVDTPKKDDDSIVFHCQRGRRSATAVEIAHRLGFTRARHYEGGYSEWAAREGL